jgi:nucleotide-binding universal stress UspA family protein
MVFSGRLVSWCGHRLFVLTTLEPVISLPLISLATVYVLFVAQDLSHFSSFYVPHGNIENFQQQAIDSAKKRMAAVVEEFSKKFPKLQTHVELGSPADKILAFAQKEKIDLIIMGVHGRTGLDRVIFGSVANKVVKNASCPVLTIHP